MDFSGFPYAAHLKSVLLHISHTRHVILAPDVKSGTLIDLAANVLHSYVLHDNTFKERRKHTV